MICRCIKVHLHSMYFIRNCHMTRIWAFILNKQGNNWNFTKWINSWGYGGYGYKGLAPSSNTGLNYYVFTMYDLDITPVMEPTNTYNVKVFRYMESVNIIGYGNIIAAYCRFNRGW